MLYAEFRRHLGKAGMTVNNFAAYLGVRPQSVSNYSISGIVPRTYAIIAILLGEAADRGVDTAEVLENFGVAPCSVQKGGDVEQLDMFRASRAPQAQGERLKTRAGMIQNEETFTECPTTTRQPRSDV